ncbi:hypothetical protein B9Z55_005987 [Caenorhabditis nigoni]|uniref:Major sperm protein n=2 Tax=Caenorhabditis nigoni TaxID=1611254 RepID=A0A2G5V381_9PELO|nr:hypothetical protein B9Z55_005987 [Caenorhabditis nigoni]
MINIMLVDPFVISVTGNEIYGLKVYEPPFVIHQGKVVEEFLKLHSDGKSLLTTPTKYVVFCGLTELTGRSCDHVELKNPTKNTILFNIRTPVSKCFFVKPRVGMVEPNKTVKVYFTFKGKCHRVPSDYCWIYNIYHIVIGQKDTAFIKEDEFSSMNLRTVWNENGKGDINNILHLACLFDEKAKVKHECKGHKIDRGLHLNDQGEVEQVVVEESKGEASSTPSKIVKLKKTPSSSDTTDELPKTADS